MADHIPCSSNADCTDPKTCVDGSCQHIQKSGNADITISTPILKKDVENRIITGIVLEPGVVDSQGHFETEEEIEKAAHRYLAKYGTGTGLDLQHDGVDDPPFELIESWVTKSDDTWTNPGGEEETVKKGTWIISVHATTDEAWEMVTSGELNGFSIEGFGTLS